MTYGEILNKYWGLLEQRNCVILTIFVTNMRKLDFDDLWKNHLFDYKDGDLLVIDDITRLQLADY